MRLGGLLRTSFSDFPGRVAAVAFTRGCNYRCPYCHNPELVEVRGADPVAEEELFDLLHRRRGQLDGVVFTGGEPTLQPDLADVLRRVRDLGFETKLDTNGSRPEVIETLLVDDLVDFVAMDVKAPLERYPEVAGVAADGVERSIELLLNATIEVEFRTTVVPGLLEWADILAIGELVRRAPRYVLQPFVPGKTLLPGLSDEPPPAGDLEQLRAALIERGVICSVR